MSAEAINRVITEFREGYNTGDAERVLSCLASEGFTDMSDESPSFWGAEAREAMRIRLRHLFAENTAELVPVIIDFDFVAPDTALSSGWLKITLKSKRGGGVQRFKQRYFQIWKKQDNGSWRIRFLMTNREHQPLMVEDLAKNPALAKVPASF